MPPDKTVSRLHKIKKKEAPLPPTPTAIEAPKSDPCSSSSSINNAGSSSGWRQQVTNFLSTPSRRNSFNKRSIDNIEHGDWISVGTNNQPHTPLRTRRTLTKPNGPQYTPRPSILRDKNAPLPPSRASRALPSINSSDTVGDEDSMTRDYQITVPQNEDAVEHELPRTWWSQTAKCLTWICWTECLFDFFGTKDKSFIQAWREKITLCFIILILMCFVGFFTLGLKPAFCPDDPNSTLEPYFERNKPFSKPYRDDVIIGGYVYSFNDTRQRIFDKSNGAINLTSDWYGADITMLFQNKPSPCANFGNVTCYVQNKFPASPPLAPAPGQPCPTLAWLAGIYPKHKLYFSWEEVLAQRSPHNLLVFSGSVINVTSYLNNSSGGASIFANLSEVDGAIRHSLGRDATLYFSNSVTKRAAADCLLSLSRVGSIDSQLPGCLTVQIIESVALVTILTLVLTRFCMAVMFSWFVSRRLTRSSGKIKLRGPVSVPVVASAGSELTIISEKLNQIESLSAVRMATDDDERESPFVILLVTCYSEDEEGVRKTLESLSAVEYPDCRKLLFVICDGIVKGSGNPDTTPDMVVNMMTESEAIPVAEPKSYIAIATGTKQHNRARVHAGYFNSRDFPTSRVPMVTIVKCGSANEYRSAQTTANNTGKDISSLKPGNRGKRDSQMLLMNFLSFVIDKEHQLMDELHYELYYRIKAITGRDASDYSIVLMVDADTTVESDALRYMVNAMNNDELIMGLCGETRIANKRTSWVTMIQVFEYYISHHLGKSFESMFGGVTCLPGCFCMYRIYAHKGDGVHTVPLLTAPEIVNEYAEPQVDTLHKKNLLLLGEDRFLSTLMLRTFPKRKMVFVPQAICRTIVPDQFKVLLSQRRRWINSTIHNLMQLVQIRELCGTFCLSMRFVVALELLGTVVMPAALLFTFYLLLSAIFTGKVEVLPLTMLILMLGLPGVLILITTWKWIYVSWMFIYILAMPIWNFVLPLYAFWNFDDFSWGQTRVADGGNGAHGEGDENRRDETVEIVPRLRFEDWERERIEGRYNTVGSVPSRPADSVKVVSNGPSNARNLPFFGINLSRDNSVVSDSNSVQIVELPFTESINSYSNDQSLTSELNQNGNPNRRKNTNQTKQNSGFESTGSSSIGQSSSTASTVSLKNMRDHILDMFIQNSPVIERTTKSNDQATSYSAGSQAEAKNVDARAELSKASNNNLSRREMAKSTKNLPKINSMRDVSSETPTSSQTRQDSTISPICLTNIKNSHQHNYQPDPLSPTFSILANKVKEFENRSKNKWEKTGGGTESSSSVVEKIDSSSFDSVPVPPHKRAGKTSIEEASKLSEAKKNWSKLPTPPTANGTTDSDEDSNLESVKGKENAASSSSTRIRPSGPRIDTTRVGKSRSINSGSSRSSQPSPYFPVYDGGIPIPGTSYHSQYSAGSAEYASVPYYHHPVYYPHHEATFGQPYSYGQTPPEFFNYMRSSGYLSNPGSIQNNPSRTSIETGSSSYINPYQSGVPHHGFVPTRASIESMRSHHSYHSTGYVPMQFPQTQYSGYGSMISPAVPGHITYNYGSDDENASQ